MGHGGQLAEKYLYDLYFPEPSNFIFVIIQAHLLNTFFAFILKKKKQA